MFVSSFSLCICFLFRHELRMTRSTRLVCRQLLVDCGIGVSSTDPSSEPVVSQHRVLLFCQLKSMLDIVEQDLLK